MAQTGFTPIQIYSSSTAAAAPVAGSLTNSTLGSELAINITDGKLFYKDNANAIQVIGWKTTPTTAGGTGLTSYTAGDLLFYASGTALSNLAIGASGSYLSSSGTAPQWTAPAALTKTDDTNVTLTLGGSASTSLLNAASLTLGWTGQLAVTRGGTGLSSVAQGDLIYGSASNTLVALAKNTTATRYLSNTGASNNPAWAQIDLTDGVTGILPAGNGGTGNGFTQFSGPTTSTKTITLPDSNATMARTDAAQTFTGDQTFAATLIKNQVNAGSSGSPANDVVLQFYNNANRCQLRAYNIFSNLAERTWWAITATNDAGTQAEQMTWTFYSDISAGNHFRPTVNNTYTLGNGTFRWSEVFASNGTINTSDANSKEQIEDLSAAELRVGQALKQLIKKFKYKDSVARKGASARIHVGVIAQEVQAAFADEGLNAHNYGVFCEDTWYEVDGQAHSPGGPYYTENDPGAVKKTSLGVRYDQLLAFVVAAM
jgi:hypothetical protein